MENRRAEYRQNGYLLEKGFLDRGTVEEIHQKAKEIFRLQMRRCGIVPTDETETEFRKCMAALFEADFEAFANCGKQAQHMIELHRLALDERLVAYLRELGLAWPSICTRPVMFFNHPSLAKEKVYHTVFAHQDWRSMQGSLDAIVVWLPLVDVSVDLGALEIISGSHLWGLQTDSVDHGFGKVAIKENDDRFEPVEVEVGDALFFSSFLIHQSGNNVTDRIRWSCHFRYNNLYEDTFVERKFAHPYVYRPSEHLITPAFPTREQLEKTFHG